MEEVVLVERDPAAIQYVHFIFMYYSYFGQFKEYIEGWNEEVRASN